ncbi:MAG TPA: hypothetical protein VF407_01600, partial [Polyangiaceae bacterium]
MAQGTRALTTGSSDALEKDDDGRRYRPPGINQWRFVRAYRTTFTVIASYLWMSFRKRFLGVAYDHDQTAAVHRRNAKRVETTILALQGVFIKVGQLLSIMANFLPE